MSNTQIDFAAYSGIHSFGAACIFAGLWLVLLPLFVYRAVQRPTYVYVFTALFCAIRVTSFVIRAYISKSSSAAHDSGLNIAYQILFNVGFLGVLYSAYICVLDREENKSGTPTGLIARVVKSRRLIRVILIVAVSLGVTGAVNLFQAKSANDVDKANKLRDSSIHIFLGVTVLLGVLMILIGRSEFALPYQDGSMRYFLLLALLTGILLVREIFLSFTTNDHTKQSKEVLWYPLVAVPEILAICILGIPGIVPEKIKESPSVDELPLEQQPGHAYYPQPQRV